MGYKMPKVGVTAGQRKRTGRSQRGSHLRQKEVKKKDYSQLGRRTRGGDAVEEEQGGHLIPGEALCRVHTEQLARDHQPLEQPGGTP